MALASPAKNSVNRKASARSRRLTEVARTSFHSQGAVKPRLEQQESQEDLDTEEQSWYPNLPCKAGIRCTQPAPQKEFGVCPTDLTKGSCCNKIFCLQSTGGTRARWRRGKMVGKDQAPIATLLLRKAVCIFIFMCKNNKVDRHIETYTYTQPKIMYKASYVCFHASSCVCFSATPPTEPATRRQWTARAGGKSKSTCQKYIMGRHRPQLAPSCSSSSEEAAWKRRHLLTSKQPQQGAIDLFQLGQTQGPWKVILCFCAFQSQPTPPVYICLFFVKITQPSGEFHSNSTKNWVQQLAGNR